MKSFLFLIFSLVCVGSTIVSSDGEYRLDTIHEVPEESLSSSDDDSGGSGVEELLTEEQQQMLFSDYRFVGFRKLLGAIVAAKGEKDKIACRLPVKAFDSILHCKKWDPVLSGFSQTLLDGILQSDGWNGVKQLSDEKREELDQRGGTLNYMKRSVFFQMYETQEGLVFSRMLDFGEDSSDEEESFGDSGDSEEDE